MSERTRHGIFQTRAFSYSFVAAITAVTLPLMFCRTVHAVETLQNVKFDPLSSRAAGAATLTSTSFDIGSIDHLFDGDVSSLGRTPNISPAFVQVASTQARTVRRFRVHCSFGSNYDWWVEKADTQADMDAKSGTYARIVPMRNFLQGTWDEFTLTTPVTARIFRLTVDRHGGDDYCHINEWELYGDVVIDQLTLNPTSLSLFVNQSRTFKAFGRVEGATETIDVTNQVSWSTTGNVGSISTTGLFTASTVGAGSVLGTLRTLSSAPANVTVALGNVQPDINVLYIERTPRLAFDPNNTTYSSGLPTAGQAMTYLAHVINWGTAPVTVSYQWRFDGAVSSTGSVDIEPGKKVTVPFAWNWQAAEHTLEFSADPANTLTELSELNNRVTIRTNALLVGLWVEQGLYDHFHQHQSKLNDGANSFEDWGQRMISRWNELFAKTIFPVSPNGMLDRLALDQIIVVPDDALPLNGGLATNNPDSRDRTVDLQWGYPWDPDSVNPGAFYGFRWSGPFYLDFGSIHEMNHARFHTDLYAIDVNQPSTPKVLLTDDGGNLVAGTSDMPFIGFDVLYYNKWRDIMGAGPNVFDAHSAGVWNWKHHKRGRGNMNAPPDFETFARDLPERNHFRFSDQNGVPLAGAEVSVYQPVNENFDNTADFIFTADANGSVTLPKNPFGGSRPSAYANAAIIFKVRYRGQHYFLFQEFTDFNIEFWRGNTQDAFYTRPIDLRDNPAVVPQTAWLGNYFNGNNFETFVASHTDSALNFTWGAAAPAPNVNADNFSVYWQRDVQFTSGWKTFSITADGGVELYLDGRLVFDQAGNVGLKTWTPVIYTMSDAPFVVPGRAAANRQYHRVEVRYRHFSGDSRIAASWTDESPPSEIPVNAWRADYYDANDLTGYITSREEVLIDNDYGSGSPDPAIGSSNWSARWIGNWDFEAQNYTFTAVVDDGMRVWIDDVLVLDKWFAQPATTYTFRRAMSAGGHKIEVKYYDGSGDATARFNWAPTPVDLSVTQTDQPDPVAVECDLRYNLVVRNHDTSLNASSVTLADVLPLNVTFVSASSSQGTCSHARGTVSCSLGSLAPNAQATVTVVLRPTAVHANRTITNLVDVGSDQPDPLPANNSTSIATTVVFADRDADGLPDCWETRAGLNPDDAADAVRDRDGDGLSNHAEYLAGTDPTDPSSALKATVERSPGGLTIRFSSISGKYYRVMFKENLRDAMWQFLADSIAGTGDVLETTDPAAAALPNRFYRVEVIPPI